MSVRQRGSEVRRRDRLQIGGRFKGARDGMPGWSERLPRQCRGRDPRCCAGATGARGQSRDLRSSVPIKRDWTVARPSNYMSLLVDRSSMVGFVVWDHFDRYESFVAEMAALMKNGS